MKLFRLRGGVHPDGHKSTSSCAITSLPLPSRLYIPLQQHIGAPAEPLVTIDQHVLKGALLAASQGLISAPVHAPTSGHIENITDFAAPHPSGLPVRTIILVPDGRDEWQPTPVMADPFDQTPEQIAAQVGACGIVGMGGATFPAAVKLNLGIKNRINALIINGGECEPYLTCDDRLMQEQAAGIIDGIRIIRHALRPVRTVVAIEDNKPEAYRAMCAANHSDYGIEITKVPSLYPMGSEKQMIQAITGWEIPAMKRAIDLGIIVHNVATTAAVHQALRFGRPLVSRIVTVSGGAVRAPMNLQVPVGTLISDLLDHCGLNAEPARLLIGGPMMGQEMPHARVPVVKGCNGVIALNHRELARHPRQACIRCSRCIDACPIGLMPLEMAARLTKGNLDGAVAYGLSDCISCGSCSYVCPSHIPLAHYFNFGKGELIARAEQERRDDQTRKLAASKTERLAKVEREKEDMKRARQKSA